MPFCLPHGGRWGLRQGRRASIFVMRPNEATHRPPPANVWEWLDRDESSPLHRIYRLQSMLCALALSLRSDTLDEGSHHDHIRSFAEHAFSESEGIGGDMETWLTKTPYFSTAKT